MNVRYKWKSETTKMYRLLATCTKSNIRGTMKILGKKTENKFSKNPQMIMILQQRQHD